MNKLFLGISVSLISIFAGLYPAVLGQEIKETRTYFSRSPRLLDVITTYRGARIDPT